MIFRIFEDVFATPTGGTKGVARRHWQGLGMRYDKKLKTKTFWSKRFFSMRKHFRKKSEIGNFQKYHFFRERKKSKNRERKKMIEKVTFFDFHFFSKMIFSSKK